MLSVLEFDFEKFWLDRYLNVPLHQYGLAFALLFVLSFVGYFLTNYMFQQCGETFIQKGFSGIDLSKPDKKRIPEAQGVICGLVFLIIHFCFIPIAFWNHFYNYSAVTKSIFPHENLTEYLGALLSICCMIFLGFADDALDLRWRIKLILPTIASMPLLMVYFVNFGSTTVILPKPLRVYLGTDVNIGVLYYLFMGMLAVFCTNAINIYAGINGIEVGQSIVIALSVLIFNFVELSGSHWQAHIFSIYIMLPFLAVCFALYRRNRYPAQLFVGDTFCYFAGMTLAVVGILGHFSKTLLLFFIPQIFNFLFSVPQLFHFIPCPRHRLPRYVPDQDALVPSTMKLKPSSLSFLGRLMLQLFRCMGLIHYENLPPEHQPEGEKDSKAALHKGDSAADWVEVSNFTIINLALCYTGPLHEASLTKLMLFLQVFCTLLAFFIRYPLAWLFYEA